MTITWNGSHLLCLLQTSIVIQIGDQVVTEVALRFVTLGLFQICFSKHCKHQLAQLAWVHLLMLFTTWTTLKWQCFPRTLYLSRLGKAHCCPANKWWWVQLAPCNSVRYQGGTLWVMCALHLHRARCMWALRKLLSLPFRVPWIWAMLNWNLGILDYQVLCQWLIGQWWVDSPNRIWLMKSNLKMVGWWLDCVSLVSSWCGLAFS